MGNEDTVSLFADDNDKPETEDQAVEEVTPAKEPDSFEVPNKFEGKSYEDVVESYINLEKEFGRKSNEVGELRQLTDEILKQQVASNAAPAAEQPINNEVGFDEFLVDPASAVDKALENNPRLKQLEDNLTQRAQVEAQEALISRHGDAEAVVNSPEFMDWVQSSPTRHQMLAQAHTNLDADAAADLIDMFKSTKQSKNNEARDVRDTRAAEQLKEATVEKGSPRSNTKPKYKRSDLMRLRLEDPSRYRSMSKEIYEAYADGRVI